MDLEAPPLHVLLWIVVVIAVSITISVPILISIRLVSIDWPGPWNQLAIASFPILLGWLISAALAVATAWIFETACRWFCRSLTFSDGSTADFSGRAGQILLWWIVWLLAGRRWRFVSYEPLLEFLIYLATLWATWQVMRWFVRSIELSSGKRLAFTGAYWELLGWEILFGLSFLTVIGWAWVLAAIYRWFARNAHGDGVALQFHGEGVSVLWRTVATVLFSLPVVTIPWAWLWYARWVVRNTTLEGQLAEA
jgi:hypothetical protein